MLHRTSCGCERDIGMSKAHQPHYCEHGSLFQYAKALKRERTLDSRKYAQQNAPRRKPLKRGRGFAASPAQQRKVRDLRCITCGRDRHETTVDPAHLWPRSRGGCDDPLCVVPLCRDCHRLFDDSQYDILPTLISRGWFAEMAHVIEAHHVSPTQLLERLTGEKWSPHPETGAV